MVFRFSRLSLRFDLLDEDESNPVISSEPSHPRGTGLPRGSREPGFHMVANRSADLPSDIPFLRRDCGDGYITVFSKGKRGNLCVRRWFKPDSHMPPAAKSGPTSFFPYKREAEVKPNRNSAVSNRVKCTSRAGISHKGRRGIHKLHNKRLCDTPSATAQRARERSAYSTNGKAKSASRCAENKQGHTKSLKLNKTTKKNTGTTMAKKSIPSPFTPEQQNENFRKLIEPYIARNAMESKNHRIDGVVNEKPKTNDPRILINWHYKEAIRLQKDYRAGSIRIKKRDAPGRVYRAYANAASIRRNVSRSIERARQALINTITPQSPATIEEPPYVFPFQDVEALVEPEPDPTDGLLIPVDLPYVDPSEIPEIETTESMEDIYRSLQEPLPYTYPESPPAEDYRFLRVSFNTKLMCRFNLLMSFKK